MDTVLNRVLACRFPTCLRRYRGQLVIIAIIAAILARLGFHNGVGRILRRLPKQPMVALFSLIHARFFGGGGVAGKVVESIQ